MHCRHLSLGRSPAFMSVRAAEGHQNNHQSKYHYKHAKWHCVVSVAEVTGSPTVLIVVVRLAAITNHLVVEYIRLVGCSLVNISEFDLFQENVHHQLMLIFIQYSFVTLDENNNSGSVPKIGCPLRSFNQELRLG